MSTAIGVGAAMLALGMAPAAAQATFEATSATSLHSTQAPRTISLEDLLQAEHLGNVRFSPAGDLLAFAHETSITERPTYGYAPYVRQRVFVAKINAGPPREISGVAGTYYSLPLGETWSPDGRYLLLIAASQGEYVLAYWDASSGKVTHLPGRLDSAFLACAFVAGDRLVYATLGKDSVQRMSKVQILAGLNEKWRTAWQGEATQPTVSSANPLFETTRPAPGALMLADLSSGTVAKISDGDYGHGAIHPSPDGKRIVAVRKGMDIGQAIRPDGRQGELQIFDLTLAGAVLKQSFDDLDFSFEAVAWAPSGERLLVGAKPASASIRQARLYDVDVRTGSRRQLLSGDLSFSNPDVQAIGSLMPLGWIGGQPAAIAARAQMTSEPAPSAATRLDYGETRNSRFDLYIFGKGGARNLTEFSRTSVMTFLAPRAQRSAFVTANGALWRVAAGRAPEQVSARDAQRIIGFGLVRSPVPASMSRAYHRSETAERIALWGMTAQGAPEYLVLDLLSGRLHKGLQGELMDTGPDLNVAAFKITEGWVTRLVLDDGAQRSLATFNAGLTQHSIAHVERFSYAVGDSTLTGWVLIPPGAERGKPLPAVVFVYGGAVYGADPPMWTKPTLPYPIFNGQLLAAQGFAVIYPSTPLGPGADNDLPAILAEQTIAAIDALATRGIVDRDRIGVMGQSFGGFSTAAILSRRSDRFKAGVAMAGAYDWMFAYGMKGVDATLTDDGRSQRVDMEIIETGQIRLGKPFWKDPQPYIRNSPIFQVERIDAPLLLLQGDLDSSLTSLPDADRMYNALVRAGKKPALVRYWGEGHVAESQSAIRDQWARIKAWFNHYLQPDGARQAAASSRAGAD